MTKRVPGDEEPTNERAPIAPIPPVPPMSMDGEGFMRQQAPKPQDPTPVTDEPESGATATDDVAPEPPSSVATPGTSGLVYDDLSGPCWRRAAAAATAPRNRRGNSASIHWLASKKGAKVALP